MERRHRADEAPPDGSRRHGLGTEAGSDEDEESHPGDHRTGQSAEGQEPGDGGDGPQDQPEPDYSRNGSGRD